MNTIKIVTELREYAKKLIDAAEILEAGGTRDAQPRKFISAVTRKRMAAAQKKRWLKKAA